MAVGDDELSTMAIEELDIACALPWPDMRKVTPWGDSFVGIAPSGREVEIGAFLTETERNRLAGELRAAFAAVKTPGSTA